MLRVRTLTGRDEKGTFPVVFLPKTHNPSLAMRKTSPIPAEGYSAKYPTSYSQNRHGHQKKESLRRCHSSQEPKEGQLDVMWDSGWDHPQVEIELLRGSFCVIPVLSLDRKSWKFSDEMC